MTWVSPTPHLWVLPHLQCHCPRSGSTTSCQNLPSSLPILFPFTYSAPTARESFLIQYAIISLSDSKCSSDFPFPSLSLALNLSWSGLLVTFPLCLQSLSFGNAELSAFSGYTVCYAFVLLVTFPAKSSSCCAPGKSRAASTLSPLWSLPWFRLS